MSGIPHIVRDLEIKSPHRSQSAILLYSALWQHCSRVLLVSLQGLTEMDLDEQVPLSSPLSLIAELITTAPLFCSFNNVKYGLNSAASLSPPPHPFTDKILSNILTKLSISNFNYPSKCHRQQVSRASGRF